MKCTDSNRLAYPQSQPRRPCFPLLASHCPPVSPPRITDSETTLPVQGCSSAKTAAFTGHNVGTSITVARFRFPDGRIEDGRISRARPLLADKD